MQIGIDFGGSLIKLSINFLKKHLEILEFLNTYKEYHFDFFENDEYNYLNMIFLRAKKEEFFDFLRARAMDFGRPAGYLLAEAFIVDRTIGVEDLFHLK